MATVLPVSVLKECTKNRPASVNPPLVVPLPIDQRIDMLSDEWIERGEAQGTPIRDILAGRISVKHFTKTAHLEVCIWQIHYFMDANRENWTHGKKKYSKYERNFARTLYYAVRAIYKNLIWNLGVKPPIDKITFFRLVICMQFEPFAKYWDERHKKNIKKMMKAVKIYFEQFNIFEQEVVRKMIDQNDNLLY